MKHALILLASAALLSLPQAFAADKAEQIDQLMRKYHEYGQFNGTVLVAEGGKVIFKQGYGMANMEWGVANRPDTKFRLGSITKQFTATLILQLVEKGKLTLEATLSEVLPYYRQDTGGRVTVHHLLTHTSGIPSYTGLPNFFAEISRDPYGVEEFIKKYCSGELEFEPGSKFAYNNSGYFLLGAVLEQVTGKSYEDLLQENIFEPLGLKNTGYDHHDTILPRRAAGYSRSLDGFANAPYLDMSLPYAAGSLYSTVEDLYVWDQALYANKVLTAESKEKMFTPFLQNYAYGWAVRTRPIVEGGEERTTIGHGGGINGFNTLITRIVEDGNLIVLLNNTGGSRLGEMSRGITNILFGRPAAPPKRSIARALLDTLRTKSIEAAVAHYRELKDDRPEQYDFREPELNTLGYALLRQKKFQEAVAIFQLNVEMFTESSNAYDSLAECYAEKGETELAIKNYGKALALNPKNGNALRRLAKLQESEGN